MKKDENEKKQELSLEELLKLEKASSIICKKYENSCRSYDGSISNSVEYQLFQKYNNFHESIVFELQKVVDKFI